MKHSLSQTYSSKFMPLTVHAVDDLIFTLHYFTACMQCNFCHDSCCAYGADVDILNAERIRSAEKDLRRYVTVPAENWFSSEIIHDDEFLGSSYTRTSVIDGACVFLNRTGRGCLLHRYCMENGRDYHELKPIVCSLFPITFSDGVLLPSLELEDGSLICSKTGLSAYEGNRNELAYYFGEHFTEELDTLERRILNEEDGKSK
jgi:Fe-S-cluster containining protein